MTKIKGFAHLFGRGVNASEETVDDKEKSKKAKGRQAEEDDEKDPDAEEDDDPNNDADDQDKDPDAEDDSDDADAKNDDDDDNDEDPNVKKGRRIERNRVSRILGSQYAAGNGPLAVSLALTTGMSSTAAIRVMASAGQPQMQHQPPRISLEQRMSAVKNHQLGKDIQPIVAGSSTALISHATHLYNQVKGKK